MFQYVVEYPFVTRALSGYFQICFYEVGGIGPLNTVKGHVAGGVGQGVGAGGADGAGGVYGVLEGETLPMYHCQTAQAMVGLTDDPPLYCAWKAATCVGTTSLPIRG